MANASNFIGFSTVDKRKPPFNITDFELVKRDLLNHFSTRKGERMMLPEFGTIIYDLLMDPLDETTKELIIEDATRIIEEEPRVSMDTLKLSEDNQVVLLETQLTYLPTGVTSEIAIQFDIEAQE